MAAPALNNPVVTTGNAPAAMAREIENEAAVTKATGTKGAAKAAGGTKAGAVKSTVGAGKAKGLGVALKTGTGQTAVTKGAAGLAAKSTVGATGGAAVAAKGLGLGLGLGLGAWGPIFLGLAAAAVAYGYLRSRKAEKELSDEEIELGQAMA
jgi:hypothetical protein